VPDESKAKPSDTSEGTDVKPGVPDVLKANSSDSDNDGYKDDRGNDAHDSERNDSDDDDENPSFTLQSYDKKEHNEEYEYDDDNENVYEEEDDDLYKDVDMISIGAKHKQERKGAKEITDADQNVS
nr:hypothetical protein [Tanacetum cinerariifolium]